MVSPWRIVISRSDWAALRDHHLHDGLEHGSVLWCGVHERDRDRLLLVRRVVPAVDGCDFLPSPRGHRMLDPAFILTNAEECAQGRLAYVAVHNHGGRYAVAFSDVDLHSHERGYPALLDITCGGPVGALVIAEEAAAGDIWTQHERRPLENVRVVGGNMQTFGPGRPRPAYAAPADCDRQVRLFGPEGQAVLAGLRVGVVGLGGAGSQLSEALAYHRVGYVVGVDDDYVDETNLPRQAGVENGDQDVGKSKVSIAERRFRSVHPGGEFHRVHANIADQKAAASISDCDFVFLAADSMQARHVVNAICQQYLIPGVQMGAKVATDAEGTVTDAFAVCRPIGPGGICLWCNELICPNRLQQEALSPEQRREAQYVPEVPAPSVYAMNAMSTAMALNDFLFPIVGLSMASDMAPRWYNFLDRTFATEELMSGTGCSECAGRKGMGNRKPLPVRMV